MLFLMKDNSFKLNRRERYKKLSFGLDEQAYADLFPFHSEFTGSMVRIKDTDTYSFIVSEIIRDNPNSEHPVGTVRILSEKDAKDNELLMLALKNDYGLNIENVIVFSR